MCSFSNSNGAYQGTPHEYSVEGLSLWSMRCPWHDRPSECLNLGPSLQSIMASIYPSAPRGNLGTRRRTGSILFAKHLSQCRRYARQRVSRSQFPFWAPHRRIFSSCPDGIMGIPCGQTQRRDSGKFRVWYATWLSGIDHTEQQEA